MKRMDYSDTDLESLLVLAYKRLEEHQLVMMDDPIYEWYLAYKSDIAEMTAEDALIAFAKLSPKERANIIAYFESTGKLPLKKKPVPPALVGRKPIEKITKPLRRQHLKHKY